MTPADEPDAAAGRRPVGDVETRAANRAWWDTEADGYHDRHGDFLGDTDFVWGPEGRTEAELDLLEIRPGMTVLEIGAGAAQCSRWLAAHHDVHVVASDLSRGMLHTAQRIDADAMDPGGRGRAASRGGPASADRAASGSGAAPSHGAVPDSGAARSNGAVLDSGAALGDGADPGDGAASGGASASGTQGTRTPVPLLQCDGAALPLGDASVDRVFTAYGVIPFVADSGTVLAEAARVLRPGGRFVFSTSHPVRWAFPDVPGPEGLTAMHSYFDRTPYVESEAGMLIYAEHHRTLGDLVRQVVAAGMVLTDLVEPEWPAWNTRTWGGWSPLRGRVLPGTAIVIAERPGGPASS
ncbi:MAG: class I SAM-dependent methyltransferase [Dermatophilaceae bacterium]